MKNVNFTRLIIFFKHHRISFTALNFHQVSIKIKDITKCEGEATANNRKAKLIFFYEWVINGEWEGTKKNSENKTAYKGTFEVPNLSEEHEPRDVDVSVFIKDGKQDKLKEFMRTEGVKLIREQFSKYIASLKEGKHTIC